MDETDLCFLGGTPHGLTDVFGLRSEEIDSLRDDDRNWIGPADGEDFMGQDKYECSCLCDVVRLQGAVPLLKFEEDFYAGYPALTRHTFGAGNAFYVCADAEQTFLDKLFGKIAEELKIEPILSALPDDACVFAV